MGRLRKTVSWLSYLLIAVALALNAYIYQYDRILGCKWSEDADFRALAFGDPQILGRYDWMGWRKRLDIVGNDYYLGHIFSTMTKHWNPDTSFVMGDLISSQWIDNDEFERRARRYTSRVFKMYPGSRLYNVCGNHDIGYAGEMTNERVDRFEKIYGKVNFVDYLPVRGHTIRIVAINSLSLDGPIWNEDYQKDTRKFLQEISESNAQFHGPTILLTHVPLCKENGVCKDGPRYTYWDQEGVEGLLRSQNLLSQESTDLVLTSVFGTSPPFNGAILAGHDHDGCETEYIFDTELQIWRVATAADTMQASNERIRELTVRSMMGEYGGNTGMLSGILDKSSAEWRFDFHLCSLGIQHIWWATKVVTLIAMAAWTLTVFA